jgi:hypothetical protein
MVPPPRHLAAAISSRIKVMSNLDIAERRLPQDGRIELNVGGNPVDLRVSILPTLFGESCVIRVLDRTVVSLDLEKCQPGVIQKNASRSGQYNAARLPLQQLCADFSFEIANLPAQRRLRGVQSPLGSGQQAAFLGNRNEIA